LVAVFKGPQKFKDPGSCLIQQVPEILYHDMKSTANSQVLPLIDEAATWQRKKPSNFEQMLVPLVRKHGSFFFDVTKLLVHNRNGRLFFLLKFIQSRIKT